MAFHPSTAAEIARRVMEGQYKLAQMDGFFREAMNDVLRKGSSYISFKIDDRKRGYSQSHWRKLKKERAAQGPVTIKLSRVSPWITVLNTGEGLSQ